MLVLTDTEIAILEGSLNGSLAECRRYVKQFRTITGITTDDHNFEDVKIIQGKIVVIESLLEKLRIAFD